MQAIVIPTNSDGSFSPAITTPLPLGQIHVSPLFLIPAYLNVNTNATTRGDAQVSGPQSDLLLEAESLCKASYWVLLQPPQAYAELNEFQGNRWLETARWLGYEENLNPNTGQWGPSHVSFLTFNSLLQLRKLMSSGERGSPAEAQIATFWVVASR